MKTKVYLRIADAPKGIKVMADKKRKLEPLKNAYGPYYPTVCIALNIEIPDELFKKAQVELDIKIKEAESAAEIKVTEN